LGVDTLGLGLIGTSASCRRQGAPGLNSPVHRPFASASLASPLYTEPIPLVMFPPLAPRERLAWTHSCAGDTRMAHTTKLIAVVKKLAGRVCPMQPDASPSLDVRDFQASSKHASDTQARPERRQPGGPVAKAEIHARPTPESSGIRRAAEADGAPVSRQRDGEICDVCGHVNGEVTIACRQCDVPLPRSVL